MTDSPSPSGCWIPLGVPNGARVFQLPTNQKRPAKGDVGAHHNALPLSAANLVPGPAASYGIALSTRDYGCQWLLVDQDRENDAAAAFLEHLPVTWMQRTRRGAHRLYRVPKGFKGRNTVWPGGEIKVNGYLVGPGSTVDGHVYRLEDPQEPVDVPPMLLAMVTPKAESADAIAERAQLLDGERDNALTSMAGFYRGRLGLDEDAIAALLRATLASGVVEQPPGREMVESDIRRIAHSAIRWEAGKQDDIRLIAGHWERGDDIVLVEQAIKWWVHGFVPRNELTLMYGDGGIGKSSWASWLAAEVTKQDGYFAYIGVEEPFIRFLFRAVLGGAEREKIYGIPNASKIIFPRDAEALGRQLKAGGIDCVYFDSIYSHFPTGDGSNAAERARHVLGSLAEIAALGITVIGVFHENKAGEYLGSAEMRNVPRYVLHAKRDVSKPSNPLYIEVDKQNIWDPGHAMQFHAEEQPLTDPLTGQTQMQELPSGELVPMTMRILEHTGFVAKAPKPDETIDLENESSSLGRKSIPPLGPLTSS